VALNGLVYSDMRRLTILVDMRRLTILVLAAGCATGTHSRQSPTVRVAPIKSELSADQQAEHALSRLAYGARPGDVDRVKRMGVEEWIAMQLSPERLADKSADSALATYRSLGTPTSELAMTFREVQMARRDTSRAQPRADLMEARRSLQLSLTEVGAAKLARAVLSERQLYEQMVDFWENHFSVFSGKGQTRLFIPSYDRDVIRPHALGRFRDLLGAVAKSPAMLFYLDNARSSARGLNENYARELMELHTLGVDGGYAQRDVQEVARALTGWAIDPREGAFVFRPRQHDDGEKVILGERVRAGGGIEDGERVLDMLAKHPSTARHITRKLVVRFVSDSAPAALVARCASVFSRTDGDIRATLQCVIASPEFFSRAAYHAKVKTPMELVASALRAANATPDGSPRSTQVLVRLGQPIFGRQTPDGWPDTADEWVNAGAMVNRVNFTLSLASGRVPGIRATPADSAVSALLSSPDFQRR